MNPNTPPHSEHPLVHGRGVDWHKSQKAAQEREFHLSEGLSADVHHIVGRCYGLQCNGSVSDALAHIVMPNINVFGVAVMHGVLGKQLRTPIVDEEWGRC